MKILCRLVRSSRNAKHFHKGRVLALILSPFINLTFGRRIKYKTTLCAHIVILLFIRWNESMKRIYLHEFFSCKPSPKSTGMRVHFFATFIVHTSAMCTSIKVNMNRLISIWCGFVHLTPLARTHTHTHTSSAISTRIIYLHFEYCEIFTNDIIFYGPLLLVFLTFHCFTYRTQIVGAPRSSA